MLRSPQRTKKRIRKVDGGYVAHVSLVCFDGDEIPLFVTEPEESRSLARVWANMLLAEFWYGEDATERWGDPTAGL